MDRRNLTALLGILAVAGYQNRDKIASALRELTGGGQPQTSGVQPGGAAAPQSDGGLGGILGDLARGTQPNGGGAASQTDGGGLGGLGGLLGGLAGGGLGDLLKGGSAGGILSGGLGGLLDHFQQNGYGDTANSWVSPNENKPIDNGQLSEALGPDMLDELARATGLSKEDIVGRLSKSLPKAVDDLTPQGRVPDSGSFSV
jgi:uncharacterized protein YidB (DUF937 family)